MATNPAKRQRVDSLVAGPAAETTPAQQGAAITHHSSEQIQSWIASLPTETVKSILHDAALAVPSVAITIRTYVEIKQREEQECVLNFDGYSKSAWHALNANYGSGAREYEAAFDVASKIEKMLQTMLSQTHAHSSYGTKFSCVETMRKIFKSTLLSTGQVPSEVQKHSYAWGDYFVQALGRFDDVEKADLVCEDEGAWFDKFMELVKLADSYCCFEELGGLEAELEDIQTQEFEDDRANGPLVDHDEEDEDADEDYDD